MSKFDERTIDGVRLLTVPLPGLDALDLMPELLAALAPGGGMAQSGQFTLGEGLGAIAAAFVGGRLSALLARLLAGTTMIAGGEKYDLGKGRSEINRAFDARPDLVVPMLKAVWEVSFARFLGGFALAGFDLSAIRKAFNSAASTPSTSAAGSPTD